METAASMLTARHSLERVASTIEKLQAEGADIEVVPLRETITKALEDMDQFVGECQETTPFAMAFVVMIGGRSMWRCTHDPAHTWAA